MTRDKVFDVFSKLFLIQLVEVIQFNLNKDTLQMDVLCIEEKGTIEQKYHLKFSGVIAFDYWKNNGVLTDDNLEVDVDDGFMTALSEMKNYSHLNPENRDEYWCLQIANDGVHLSVVFNNVIKAKHN
jgi:hypothetical protein